MNLLGSERDRPPHFAGRKRELSELASRLDYIRASSDPSGGMVLIDGLQGAGKTHTSPTQHCHPPKPPRFSKAMPADPLTTATSPEALLRNAYEAGVLTLDEAGRLTFGVPSFGDYLIEGNG